VDGSRAFGGRSESTLGEAWAELKSNTLRKTVPQLLLAVWFLGLAVGRHDFNSPTPNHPALIVAFAVGFAFYAIVFIRVLSVLPRRAASLLYLWALFIGYTLWLGFAPPVHSRDVRESLGWFAMVSGLVVFLVLLPTWCCPSG
jgi:hypothetical protein